MDHDLTRFVGEREIELQPSHVKLYIKQLLAHGGNGVYAQSEYPVLVSSGKLTHLHRPTSSTVI